MCRKIALVKQCRYGGPRKMAGMLFYSGRGIRPPGCQGSAETCVGVVFRT